MAKGVGRRVEGKLNSIDLIKETHLHFLLSICNLNKAILYPFRWFSVGS